MDKINIVKFLTVFFTVALSFIGLNSCMYSRRTKRFYASYLLLCWCITVFLIFGYIYIIPVYNEIISEEFDLKNAVTLYYYMNIIGAAMNYLSQLINRKASVDFLNNLQLFTTINYLYVEIKTIKSAVLLVILKTIIFPTIIEITLILRHLCDYDVNKKKNLLLTIYVIFPIVAASIIQNYLFGVFVICWQLTLALNRHLIKLEKEANFLQMREQMLLHKHFYRMQKFCNMADKLEELSEKYSVICSQTLTYMSLCTTSFLVSLLCNLFGITAGFFRQYYALADTLINEETYDVFNAMTNGVFLIIYILDISFHSLVGNQSIEAAKETGLILKRIKLDNADTRLKQAVESFSYRIIVINFKLKPMKLLNVDLSLLHNVLSAVTSFLLILIQSDLTLRFSLK